MTGSSPWQSRASGVGYSVRELNLVLDNEADAPVIRVAGSLRHGDAVALGHALREAMAECPVAIVVDLSALLVVDRAVMRVFPTVAHGREWWPGTELIAAAPSPAVDTLLDTQPGLFDRYFPSVEQALDAIRCGDGAPPRGVRGPLAGWTAASWQARQLVDEFCATWDLDWLLPEARTVATELVENASCTSGDITLTVALRNSYLHIAVRDRGHQEGWPAAAGKPEAAPRIFGLRLVEKFSTSWGVTQTHDGKIVWASLRVRPLLPHLAGTRQSAEPDADPTTSKAKGWPSQQRPAGFLPVLSAIHDPNVSLALSNPITTIGRTANNDLVLDHPSVSRNHAVICRTRDGFMLVDLGSVNGVWVDGRRLRTHQSTPLTEPATVRIGDLEMSFTRPAAHPVRRATIATAVRSLLHRR